MWVAMNAEAEVQGHLATGTAESWSFVRAVTVDVAEQAALLGSARGRVGSWEVSALRRAFGDWPPGHAQLVLTLTCAGRLVLRWPAEVPATESLQ